MKLQTIASHLLWVLLVLSSRHRSTHADEASRKHVRHERRHALHVPAASPPSGQQSAVDRMRDAAENARAASLMADLRQAEALDEEGVGGMNVSNNSQWHGDSTEYEDYDSTYNDYSQSKDREDVAHAGGVNEPKDLDPDFPPVEPGQALTKEQWKLRIRAKYYRLFMIQAEIMRVLGLTKQPNITTGIHISNLDAVAMDKYKNLTSDPQAEATGNAHRYHFTSPSCELPHKTRKVWWDPAYFRLYFTPKAPESHPLAEFKMQSAALRLYKKGPIKEEFESKDQTTAGPDPFENRVPLPKHHRKSPRATHAGSQSTRERSRRKAEKLKKKQSSLKRNLKSHKLRTRQKEPEEEKTKQLRITINAFKKPLKKNKTAKKQMKTSMMVDRDYIGWVEIDIRHLVRRWMRRPRKNYGIEIYVEDDELVPIDPHQVFDNINCTTKNSYQDVFYLDVKTLDEGQLLNETLYDGAFNLTLPNLETTLVEVPTKVDRRKRHTSETCVKESTFVSFAEMGLSEWILAPQGLEAVYCKGHCKPVSNRIRYEVGANRNNDTKTFKECCGPTKFKPFRFLHYIESNKLTVSSVDDFIVSACGCRE